MSSWASLRITVEIIVDASVAAGQHLRHYRLSDQLAAPGQFHFPGPLPISGSCRARLRFTLPAGMTIACTGSVSHDPELPAEGSWAELDPLPPDEAEAMRAAVTGKTC